MNSIGAIGGGCLFSRRPEGSGLGLVSSGRGGGVVSTGGRGGVICSGGRGGVVCSGGGGGFKSCTGEPSPVTSASFVGARMVSIRNKTSVPE